MVGYSVVTLANPFFQGMTRGVQDGIGSVKNLGRYAASWIACWRKRLSSTAALT